MTPSDMPKLTVRRDAPDLRDEYYRPALRPLAPSLLPVELLQRIERRNQGVEGSCTGQALANVIDVLRGRDGVPPVDKVSPASARMLVELARPIELQGARPTPETDGSTSLRPTLKAFYHHGVCLDATWPYYDGDPCGELTRERLVEARKLTLGAYFRVHPILNDFHAALNEAGAIYAAATVHAGWSPKAVADAGGRIRFDPDAPIDPDWGGHAFAIVGYDEEGFIILNSWGDQWGGFSKVPALAHWSYPDWATNILDAWVIRLAVSTPTAFEFSVGRQGIFGGLNIPIRAGSTPRGEVIGHYLHLDDGDYVTVGSYPSSAASFELTVQHLLAQAKEKYDHVLVWLAGANESTTEVMADVARLKEYWKNRRIYPITVLWCSDFVESVADVLNGVFAAAQAQIPEPGDELNRLIEGRVRGAGRAFLRDIKRSGREAIRNVLKDVMAGLQRLNKAGYSLHIAAEGVGATLLSDLAAPKRGKSALPPLANCILLAPTLTLERLKALCAARPVGQNKIVLATADEATEAAMGVGPYSGSILRLVDLAFEEEPNQVVGLPDIALSIEEGTVELALLQPLADPTRARLRDLTRGKSAIDLILNRILGHAAGMSPAPLARNPRAL